MSKKSKLVVNIIEWVLILVFGCFSLFLWTSSKKLSKEYDNMNMVREQVIDALTDSIQSLKNKPTTLTYRYTHDGDTIYVKRKLTPMDDSVYNFTSSEGPISYQIKIKAKDVSWYKIKIKVNNTKK